ncbi:MAG: hypothetical protein LUF04_02450 [Bacteroides sp.]|nr:hypothetical protein [Bacteroides sp.]
MPLEASDLQTKDIYVIANYDNEAALDAVGSVDSMKVLFTPEVDKTNNLDPANGFCMYGYAGSVDFTDSANLPAYVELTRTCAKFRINLSFPDGAELSTDNSFLMLNAARYTHVMENLTEVLPVSDYFNFAATLPLTDNGNEIYTSIAYVYESSQAPSITIYTHLNNSTEEQEFTAKLPVPMRNYLYDLEIYVYQEEESATRSIKANSSPVYTCCSKITIYNERGEK